MHVLMYSPTVPLENVPNGVVTYTRIMRRALEELGCRVTVFNAEKSEDSDRTVTVFANQYTPLKRVWTWIVSIVKPESYSTLNRLQTAIDSIALKEPIDVFEMEESFGWVGGLKVAFPVIARLHGPHAWGKDDNEPNDVSRESQKRIKDEGFSLRQVNAVTSPSANLLETTLSLYGDVSAHDAVIPNPMAVSADADLWNVDRCDPNQILFVGRFDLRKGADIALKAFALVAQNKPNLLMVMCGPDRGIREADGSIIHFDEFWEKRVPSELRDRVIYKGPTSFEDLCRLRKSSTICLSTARFETFSYSLAEALAFGVPIITTKTFGIPEMIEDGISGFVCRSNEPIDVAESIGKALSNRRRLALVGEAGRKLCADQLSPHVVAEKTLGLYRMLLDEAKCFSA